ncbi:uncharacterized protein [Lepeophtheirus salmonis]|uniref:uncharacterized protein n=1 Tax=Lepeophtheirus salmonis TaxID=72036 RepID=UPI001AE8F257|nr:uncharacterized protein LOC121127885 [Lepeophtheirus salmonis]
MIVFFTLWCVLLLNQQGVFGENHRNRDTDLLVKDSSPDGKFLSIFNVVSFQNNICSSSATRNGTCFTAAECTSKGGSASGTCASGYGVCCVFILGCGTMSNANCTYLEQTSITSATSLSMNPCTYTICKCSSEACRLRLDFTTNILALPVIGTQAATAAENLGGALGDCTVDFMTLSSPGGQASPAICGFNTGQHMIVDMSDTGCNELTFNLGTASSTARQWSIKATQFVCNDDNGSGGPPGCLQYFTEPSGTVASYNFDTSASVVAPTATHLSNQQYNICFRQGEGNCQICYTRHATNSFGVSISPAAAAAQAGVGTVCSTDWITIPEGAVGPFPTPVTGTNPTGNNRFCGRLLSGADGDAAGTTVCSIVSPFVLGVNFDSNEANTGAADSSTNELAIIPGGTTGFWLDYTQNPC